MEWGIEIRKRQIVVDTMGRTTVPGIYAAGDIVDYEGKVKLIATGFGEVATAVNNAAAYLNPKVSAFPGHLSDYAPADGSRPPRRSTANRAESPTAMIVGVGIDVVPVARFAEALQRSPALADAAVHRRPSWTTGHGEPRTAESLAARFAAKEALAKALGAGGGMHWTDAEVLTDDAGRPSLVVRGTVAERADSLGRHPLARVALARRRDRRGDRDRRVRWRMSSGLCSGRCTASTRSPRSARPKRR